MSSARPRARRGIVATVLLAGGLALLAGSAAAMPPPAPSPLRVEGGEGNWLADNDFRLDWPDPQGYAVAAVGLRILDEAGAIVREARFPQRLDRLERIRLPRPGHFTAQVWLESPHGERGPVEKAALLFDDTQPGAVTPLVGGGWIGGDSTPLLRLSRPRPPLPISGIRGYAVSLSEEPWGSPCAGADRCSRAETDLNGGSELDWMRLGRLPEGTLYAHAVAVSSSGMRSASVGTATLRVDATAPSLSLRAERAWTNRAVTVEATAFDQLSGMAASGPDGPFTALMVDGEAATVAAGDTASATIITEGSHRVSFRARDAAGNLSSPEVRAVGIDRSGPRVAFANELDAADPEAIVAVVSDELSGPSSSWGSIGVRAARSNRQFSPLPSSVSGNRILARWNSDAYPPGSYEFRAIAYDGVGNRTESRRRGNGSAMVLANPLKAPSRLRAGFGGAKLVWHRCSRKGERRRCRSEQIAAFEARPTTRVVPYGRRLIVSGNLSSGGSALAGAAVRLTETYQVGGLTRHRQRLLDTAADGTFRARLAAGPSRQVAFAFAGDRTHAAADGPRLRLGVRARLRLRASASRASVGGAPVVFSGAIRDAAALPAQGKAVELQFRLPGLPWTEFRTIRTKLDGSFRHAYRFSDDDSRGVRFQFRAVAPAEAGWPYESTASRPLAVRGT